METILQKLKNKEYKELGIIITKEEQIMFR